MRSRYVRLLMAGLLSLSLTVGFGPAALAHSIFSGYGCNHVGNGLNAYHQGGFNGHSGNFFGAFAFTKVIDNFGSAACGHVGSEPTSYQPGARWKTYREGLQCSQSSLVFTSSAQNTIAIGIDYNWSHIVVDRGGGPTAVAALYLAC